MLEETHLGVFCWAIIGQYTKVWMSSVSNHCRPGSASLVFHCSGSLITQRLVLTAGHCVLPGWDMVVARVGEHSVQGPDPPFFINRTEHGGHPQIVLHKVGDAESLTVLIFCCGHPSSHNLYIQLDQLFIIFIYMYFNQTYIIYLSSKSKNSFRYVRKSRLYCVYVYRYFQGRPGALERVNSPEMWKPILTLYWVVAISVIY